jgi:hypothetical protein
MTTPERPWVPNDPGGSLTADGSVRVELPLALVNVANRREHYMTRRRRVERERGMVTTALAATGATPPALPVTIALERAAWCALDPDGLATAVKACVDAVAEWLAVDDRDPRLHVHLSQRTTRARRVEWYGRGKRYQRTVAASTVTLTVRPWRPEDGTDRLRVLARGSEAA